MPTKAPTTLLQRELSKAEIQPWLESVIALLEEVVNYGVAAFARCLKTAKGTNESFAILFPYLHLLEMVDGVQVLLAQAAVTPAHLQLRSAFEALLTVEYIAETDSRRRAYAYLVADVRRRLAVYRTIPPNTEQGRRIRERIASDRYVRNMRIPDIRDVPVQISALEEVLDRPYWKEANKSFDDFKKSKKRAAQWYELYGGPSSLEGLASRLKRPAHYDLLYRSWSATAHVGDAVLRQLRSGARDTAMICGIRDTSEFRTVSNLAVAFALSGTRCVLQYYRPEEVSRVSGVPAFTKWYLREIRDRWMKSLEGQPPATPESL